jgi:hypothetical protein
MVRRELGRSLSRVHPLLSSVKQKYYLSNMTGLTIKQVSNWFLNARKRTKFQTTPHQFLAELQHTHQQLQSALPPSWPPTIPTLSALSNPFPPNPYRPLPPNPNRTNSDERANKETTEPREDGVTVPTAGKGEEGRKEGQKGLSQREVDSYLEKTLKGYAEYLRWQQGEGGDVDGTVNMSVDVPDMVDISGQGDNDSSIG